MVSYRYVELLLQLIENSAGEFFSPATGDKGAFRYVQMSI